MLTHAKFHPLFAKKYFTLPENNKIDDVQLSPRFPDAPLPKIDKNYQREIASLTDNFLNGKNGALYKQKILDLLNKLLQWAGNHGIMLDETATDSILLFQRHFIEHSKQIISYSKLFPLYHEGIPTLAKIIQCLERDDKALENRKTAIKQLIEELGMCGPAVYQAIIDTYLQLTHDVAAELMGIRQQIAKQTAKQLLTETLAQPNIDLINQKTKQIIGEEHMEYYEKHIIHSIICDKNELGIMDEDDEYAKEFSTILEQQFPDKIIENLTPENTIEQILWRTITAELARLKQTLANPDLGLQVKDEQLNLFIKNNLDHYGVDNGFTRYHLLDEQGAVSGLFILREDVIAYLRISLLHRLAASGFFDLSQLDKPNHNNIIFIPHSSSQELAFVINVGKENKRIPLSCYLAEQLKQATINIQLFNTWAENNIDTLATLIKFLNCFPKHSPEAFTLLDTLEPEILNKLIPDGHALTKILSVLSGQYVVDFMRTLNAYDALEETIQDNAQLYCVLKTMPINKRKLLLIDLLDINALSNLITDGVELEHVLRLLPDKHRPLFLQYIAGWNPAAINIMSDMIHNHLQFSAILSTLPPESCDDFLQQFEFDMLKKVITNSDELENTLEFLTNEKTKQALTKKISASLLQTVWQQGFFASKYSPVADFFHDDSEDSELLRAAKKQRNCGN